MQIKMRQTAPGSPDGVRVLTYEAGQTYDVTDDLGECFVRFELADPADAPAATPAAKPAAKAKAKARSKDAGAAPENKAS